MGKQIAAINAQQMTLQGARYIEAVRLGYEDNDAFSFTMDVPATGHYRMTFLGGSLNGKFNSNYLDMDGARCGDVDVDEGKDAAEVRRLYIEKGTHTFTVSKFYGGLLVESVSLEEEAPFDASLYDVRSTPVDPKASPNAHILYDYLRENYGKNVLTGQTLSGGADRWNKDDLQAIWDVTGKAPAIVGVDMMDACGTRKHLYGAQSNDPQRGIDYFHHGGLVTMAWHWNAPMHLTPEKAEHPWNKGFYTYSSSFSLKEALADKESPEFKAIIADIEDACEVLRPYKEQDIPILWRPLHEASGGWFWWGATGPEACIELWRIMFDIMVNKHEMHNLLWIWNGQHPDWYPGDDVVDIIGEDIYAGNHVYHAQNARYLRSALRPETEHKMVALTENGTIPDIDLMIRDGSMWSWYCTWCGGFVYTKNEDGSVTYNEEHTGSDMLKKVYNHPNAITLDKLNIQWNR